MYPQTVRSDPSATSTRCEFQYQCTDDPLEKTGSGCSDPASATMPVESLESSALLILRKVEAKGPNCFWATRDLPNSDARLRQRNQPAAWKVSE
jgi:hypothetical protein